MESVMAVGKSFNILLVINFIIYKNGDENETNYEGHDQII